MTEEEIAKKVEELQKKEADIKKQGEDLESKKSEIGDFEAKKAGLSQELERVRKDIDDARKEKTLERSKQEESFQEKFRKEQVTKATQKFINDFGYTDDAKKAALLAEFTKRDSGALDAENIYADLKRVHVSLNPDLYLELEKKNVQLQKDAEAFAAQASGSGFTGAYSTQNPSEVELTPDDIKAAQFSRMPLETYKRLKAEGKI